MALLFAISIGSVPTTALGDQKAQAKEHFEAGWELLQEKNFLGAAAEFEKSATLYTTPNTLFNLANCYQELRRYAEALRVFEQVETTFGNEIDDETHEAIARHRKEIFELVAVVEIDVSISGATVKVDGKVVGKSPLPSDLYLEPGVVKIEVTSEGFERTSRRVELKAGQRLRERFHLERDTVASTEGDAGTTPQEQEASGDGQPERVWTWVAAGAAGAAAAVGTVTGIASTVKARDVMLRCDGNVCPESAENAYKQADALAKTTNAMIIVAAVGAAAAITLYFVEPNDASSAEVVALVPVVSPRGAGVGIQGEF